MNNEHEPEPAAASPSPAPEPQPSPQPTRRGTKLALVACACAALVGAGVWWWMGKDIVSTDDAQTDGDAVLVTPKVAGYVSELAVNDNQRVKAGDVLLKIDPRDFIAARDQAAAALQLAIAQRQGALTQLAQTRVSAPAQLAQARAGVASALAARTQAAADLRRQTGVRPEATTQQVIDQARHAADDAEATLQRNQAQLRAADLVPQLLAQAQAQLDEADAQVAAARAKLEAAELDLTRTEIRAPQDGWVTKRNVQQGGYVQAGQALMSVVTPQVWVTANFKENQLARMRPGQPVTIKADAYGSLDLEGHVDSVQMGSGSRFSAFPPENATGNFVKIVQRVPVKIVIDRGLDPQHPLPLGLSVVPKVNVR